MVNQGKRDDGALSATASMGSSASATLNLDEYEARALPWRRQLVRTGELLPVLELLELLRDAHPRESLPDVASLCAVEVDGENYLPAFYARSSARLRSLLDVTRRLSPRSGWSAFYFFTLPNAALGGISPLEALEKSDARDDIRLRWKVEALAADQPSR
ncbi:hypothetical protein PQQ96_28520 [Paraburkholderia sediminicola]|uniref:hypothetical protein n=1 Tax=Paraburkholderia sediminicola TaxID=458836 RepID=UPI0038B815E3